MQVLNDIVMSICWLVAEWKYDLFLLSRWLHCVPYVQQTLWLCYNSTMFEKIVFWKSVGITQVHCVTIFFEGATGGDRPPERGLIFH
jgi:hypothetical protein